MDPYLIDQDPPERTSVASCYKETTTEFATSCHLYCCHTTMSTTFSNQLIKILGILVKV